MPPLIVVLFLKTNMPNEWPTLRSGLANHVHYTLIQAQSVEYGENLVGKMIVVWRFSYEM